MGDNFEHTSATTKVFTLEFLGQITDNFSEERVIGRGGYGVVYKVYTANSFQSTCQILTINSC